MEILHGHAIVYAIHEIIIELTNRQHPAKTEDMWDTWVSDGRLYERLTGEDFYERFPQALKYEDLEHVNEALRYRSEILE